MSGKPQARLYTFVDTAYLQGRSLSEVTKGLCEGGSDLIQLRAKDKDSDWIRSAASDMHSITRAHSIPLVINDHFDIACELGAEYCHLGQEDFFDEMGLRHVDQLPWPDPKDPCRPRIGLSTHAPDQAQRAVDAGADYVAIGPVYATGTKPTARPVTLDYVRWAEENVRIPWFAIGGINEETLDPVVEAGASGICIVSAILNSPDLREACQSFKGRLVSALS